MSDIDGLGTGPKFTYQDFMGIGVFLVKNVLIILIYVLCTILMVISLIKMLVLPYH